MKALAYLVGALIALLAFLLMAFHAYAHKHERPDLAPWFEGLHNAMGGSCCLDVSKEARVVEDPDYEGQPDGSYIVRFDGKEFHVTPEQLVPPPNKYGPALVWPKKDGSGVWCFLPGAGA